MTNLFEKLLKLDHDAFTTGHYSVAYHLLAAALHCAVDDNNLENLARVNTMAAEHLAWIDANAPEYEHSTLSAAARGHGSIYAMLARQAQGKTLILNRKNHWPVTHVIEEHIIEEVDQKAQLDQPETKKNGQES